MPLPNDAPDDMETRSLASVVRPIRHPSPGDPMTQSSGTKTSLKNTSLNIAAPVSSRSGRMSRPSLCMSTMKYVMPACLAASGSVRARQIPTSAVCASDVQTF